MERSTVEDTLNLSDPQTKNLLHTFIDAAQGFYFFLMTPDDPPRNNDQNSLYWVAVVTPLAVKLMEQADLPLTFKEAKDQAHVVLAAACLGIITAVDPKTGVIRESPKSTSKLTKPQFSEYYERCCVWLAEMGIIVKDGRQQQQPQRNRKVPA